MTSQPTRERSPRRGRDEARPFQRLQIPFRDEMFDVVLCRDVLHHVVDKSEAVGELIRVCRLMPMDRWVYIIITAVKAAAGKPVVSGSV